MLAPAKQAHRRISEMAPFCAPARAESMYQPQRGKVHKLPMFVNPAHVPVESQRPRVREGKLDLNDYLVKNPSKTFLIRVTGNSMIRAGINSGDILVVDRSIEPENGRIVVAAINNELLVKRLRFIDADTYLFSENDTYPPIRIGEDDRFDIWGVVTNAIKSF
ncbi:MAG: LexA family protein [Candidatus Kapaibacterium sp.]